MTALYILFGVCGYLSFGPDTHSIITLNLPQGPMPMMVKGCLCFSLYFTYPIMMFPVGTEMIFQTKIIFLFLITILTSLLVEILERRFGTANDYWKGNVLRGTCVLISAVTVTIIPDFSTIMVLIGATCCSLLGRFSYHLLKRLVKSKKEVNMKT